MHGAMANATQSIDNIIDPCATAEDQIPFLPTSLHSSSLLVPTQPTPSNPTPLHHTPPSLWSLPGHQTNIPSHVVSLSSCSIAEFSSAILTQIDSTTTEQQEHTSMDSSRVQLMSTTWNADVARYLESYIGWVTTIEAPTHRRTPCDQSHVLAEWMLRSSWNCASMLVKTSTMYFSVNFLCTRVGAVLHVPHANPRRTPVRNTSGKTVGPLCTLLKPKTCQPP